MNTVLFINSRSRKGMTQGPQIEELIRNSTRFNLTRTIVVSKKLPLKPALATLKRLKRVDCVLVASGDGTISTVLNALRKRTGVTFGFLPLGTGNVFVQSLGMPLDPEQAFKHIENAKPKTVSLGEANGYVFANIAAIGLPVKVSKYISNTTKRYLGPIAYVFSGFKHLLAHKALLCTVTVSGKERSFYTHHVVVTNGRYHGNLPVSKRASVHKNQLVLVAFGTRRSRLHYAYNMALFALKKHQSAIGVEMMTFKKASVTVRPARKLEIDGEIVGTTPVKFRVLPNSLRVLA